MFYHWQKKNQTQVDIKNNLNSFSWLPFFWVGPCSSSFCSATFLDTSRRRNETRLSTFGSTSLICRQILTYVYLCSTQGAFWQRLRQEEGRPWTRQGGLNLENPKENTRLRRAAFIGQSLAAIVRVKPHCESFDLGKAGWGDIWSLTPLFIFFSNWDASCGQIKWHWSKSGWRQIGRLDSHVAMRARQLRRASVLSAGWLMAGQAVCWC